MNCFPAEILNQVFMLLHQNQKIECMLVCHRWAKVIQNRHLLNMIQCSKWNTFKELVDQFQQEPSRGYQIQHLIITLSSENAIAYSTLLDLFPNLKKICLSINEHTALFQIEQSHYRLKRSNIEYIKDISNSSFTFHLLSYYQCSRLKTLYVSATFTNILGKRLIQLLSNCPNLENLNMGEYSITLDDLEQLHTNTPRLLSLALPLIQLLPSRYPTPVIPATAITTCSIITVNRVCEIEIQWLRYIRAKYTNLTSFSYRNVKIRNQADLGRIEREGLKPLVGQLESLSINIKDYGSRFFKTLEQATFQGECLDLSGPVQLEILDTFAHFDRARCIKSLKLRVRGINTFGWLKHLVCLTRLELIFSFPITSYGKVLKETIQINSFLDMCSDTLESLTLSGVNLDMEISSVKRVYSIVYLELFSVLLPKNMDSFLSVSLPKLKTLKLQDCALNGTVIHLPQHSLTHLLISEGEHFKDKYLLLVTDKEKRWYTAKTNIYNRYQSVIHTFPDYPPFTPPVSLSYDAWGGTPSMTFICASVNDIMLLHPYN
ncbi:hypothetical protein K501DRAFT_328498 [Backusella circina FSU 941]|nr:hypothetical protein K501DRAFT_328498 [Backusella circina FSU 941]